MSDAYTTNQAKLTSTEEFHYIWKLTRVLLTAGWRYKASSDTLVKETTGSPEQDRWAVGGGTNLSTVGGGGHTGAAASITAAVNGEQTLTGLTNIGVVTSLGRFLTISGCANPSNNGTFRVSTYISATSVKVFNPSGGGTDANNGAISWNEQQGGSVASITTVLNGIATVTGLTGLVSPTAGNPGSTGHTITFTGATNPSNNGTFQIVQVISATSCTYINPNAIGGDTGGGALVWTETDPNAQTYPASILTNAGIGAWWCGQGPSTLKLTIGTNTAAGTFIRGENVTQTGTGAQGEILGVVFDPTGGGGYAVIAPRLSGSGVGARGWSTTGVITGAWSGATVTPTGVTEFVREVVFWKGTLSAGHIYYQCIDLATEVATTATTGRFSTMAALATCTTTVCPGGANTGTPVTNGFPTWGTLVVTGVGGANTAATSAQNFSFNTNGTTTGKFTILAANALEDAGVSADGSFQIACGSPSVSITNFYGFGFERLDDTEEGDVDPYAWFAPSGSNFTNRTRVSSASAGANTQSGHWHSQWAINSGSANWHGFVRRGFSSGNVANGDAFIEFSGWVIGTNSPLYAQTTADPEKVAAAVATVRVREPIFLISTFTSALAAGRMRKGSTRWINSSMGGSGCDVFDNKRWLKVGTDGTPAVANIGLLIGPYDQASVPVNS